MKIERGELDFSLLPQGLIVTGTINGNLLMAYMGPGFFYVSDTLTAGYNIGKAVKEFMKKISTLKACGLYQAPDAGILFTIGTTGVCIDGYPDSKGGTTTSDEFSKTIEGNTSAAATLIMKK